MRNSNCFVLIFFGVTFLLIGVSRVVAQEQKFGYAAADQIMLLMPEARTIDSIVRRFKTDSIDAILPYVMSEYQRKDSILGKEKNDIIKKQIEREMAELKSRLDNWGAIAQAQIQRKQNELLAPVYQKISTAIKNVADEEGYTYIFRAETLLHAPEADNVSMKVIEKLGIDIPDGSGN